MSDENNESASEIEVKARDMGWVPQDEYHGAKPWRTAEEFVERANTVAPLQASRIEYLERRLARQEEQFKQQMGAQREVFESQIKELKAARKEAIQLGDADEVDKLDERIEVLKARTAETHEPPVQIAPELQAWAERNAHWVDKTDTEEHIEMTQAAIDIGRAIQKAQPSITPRELVVELDRRLKRIYGDAMSAGGRSAAPESDSSRRASQGTGKDDTRIEVDGTMRSYRDLPKAAQEVCDRLISQGKIKDRKQYVQYYQW